MRAVDHVGQLFNSPNNSGQMTKVLLAAALLCTTLCGCVRRSGDVINYPAGTILSFEAIQRAASAAPRPVYGLFWLRVQATGSIGDEVYLNSEQDYRDQRNITIVLRPAVAKALAKTYGANLPDVFLHHSMLVRGAARRVTIHFASEGQPSTKYYYQTHIVVTDPEQIGFERRPLPVP